MKDTGFTLTEVMATMGIMAILSAIAVPTYITVKDAAVNAVEKSTTSPERCARDILSQYDISVTDYLIDTPLPIEARDRVIEECLLPYLTPATAETAR